MNIYERLKRVAKIEPGCFIGDGCSMHEIARDALEERNRLLVLATKHCPRDHHDWQEILRIAGDA